MGESAAKKRGPYFKVMPATVTLSAAGLARAAGEGVAAAALEAAAGGACKWRVKPPPGWRGDLGGGVGGGHADEGSEPVPEMGGESGGGWGRRSCEGRVSQLQAAAVRTTVCASAVEAVRLVMSSSSSSSSSCDDDGDEERDAGRVRNAAAEGPSQRGGKWFLQQQVEGNRGGVFEVHASVLVVGALRIELHRHVRGLDEAISKTSSSSAPPVLGPPSGESGCGSPSGAAAAAARTAVADTIRAAIVNAAKHRKCFLPFPNCFEVFSARMLLARVGQNGGDDEDDDEPRWRAWLLRLDDAFAEEKSSGDTSSSSSGHTLDALAADAVTAACEGLFSCHSSTRGSQSGPPLAPAAGEETANEAFEIIFDRSRGD